MQIETPVSYLKRPALWAAFILYIIVLSFAILHHELWGDEIHSWNIAKASAGFGDLIANTRYEGHPPLWYIIIWTVSKFTHNVSYIQLVQWMIAVSIAFVILFFSSFPPAIRVLILFGYYFIFEYAVFSRNYAPAVLAAFCICVIMHKKFRYKFLLYYALLFCMSNTHLLAVPLACSLHAYFLFLQKKKAQAFVLHILLGALVCFSSLYFIFPPTDSEMNTGFWTSRWNIHHVTAFSQVPLRAFIPVPAWWNYNFWNTQFLLELQPGYRILKWLNPLIAITLVALAFFILRGNKKSLILFATSLLLSFIIAVAAFPLTTARYSGFIYISFIATYWLYCDEAPVKKINQWLVYGLLTAQIIAGVFAVSKDIQFPFSNSYRVKELLKLVPENNKTVTDYWALNSLAAFTDKPYYCLELHKEISFLLWNSELGEAKRLSNSYYNGIKYLFQKQGLKQVYMVSTHSLQNILQLDSQLSKSFQVKLVGKIDGAIEKGSNLYLYEIKLNSIQAP